MRAPLNTCWALGLNPTDSGRFRSARWPSGRDLQFVYLIDACKSVGQHHRQRVCSRTTWATGPPSDNGLLFAIQLRKHTNSKEDEAHEDEEGENVPSVSLVPVVLLYHSNTAAAERSAERGADEN